MLGKNKKGSIQDLVLIAVVLLFFGLIVLISFKVNTEFTNQVQSTSFMPTNSKNVASQMTAYYPGVIDNSYLFLAISLGIGALVLAALVRVHPIFIPLFFVAWIFIIFLAGIFSNLYTAVASDPEFIALANQLTVTTNIMTFLPMFIGVFGILLMIVQYKTWRTAQE